MPTDTLQRFREKTRRLSGTESQKVRLEQLLEQIRAAADDFRSATERHIAGVLALADEAAAIWDATWEAALKNPAKGRANEGEMLRWLLEETGQVLQEALREAQTRAGHFEPPPARLDELKARAEEFPLWARACLARWEMLDRPHKPLDRERLARARAAYARGECEDVADIIARLEQGGPLVRE